MSGRKVGLLRSLAEFCSYSSSLQLLFTQSAVDVMFAVTAADVAVAAMHGMMMLRYLCC